MLNFFYPTNRTENGERDQARFLRMLDQHIELIRQHRAVINAHLSRIDHQGIDKEKENDQEFVEKFNEIKVGYFSSM